MVTIMYWYLLYNPKKGASLQNVLAHSVPLIGSITEIILNKVHIELNMWLLVLKFSLCYIILLILWTKTGAERNDPKHYIYPQTKLRTAGSWIFILIILIAVCLVFFLTFALWKCKYVYCGGKAAKKLSLDEKRDGVELSGAEQKNR